MSVTKYFDARQSRLQKERELLETLNEESDYVRVKPENVLPGSEPEEYVVTFLCRGIISIDALQRPMYGDKHQVRIVCDEKFPGEVPQLRWVTDIWHPNIQHAEPKGVCVNKPEWLGGMMLYDLCRLMFEMVQYKNYHHIENVKPYPLDYDVARWVRDYAEPNRIINKSLGIYADDKPFVRPSVTERIKVSSQATISVVPPVSGRIKILSSPAIEVAPVPTESRIKIL